MPNNRQRLLRLRCRRPTQHLWLRPHPRLQPPGVVVVVPLLVAVVVPPLAGVVVHQLHVVVQQLHVVVHRLHVVAPLPAAVVVRRLHVVVPLLVVVVVLLRWYKRQLRRRSLVRVAC